MAKANQHLPCPCGQSSDTFSYDKNGFGSVSVVEKIIMKITLMKELLSESIAKE